MAGLKQDACVIVATIRSLKYNGGIPKDKLSEPNPDALKKGIVNLGKHIENIQQYGVPVIVTLNAFLSDTEEETSIVREYCRERGCDFALSKVWEKGGEGGIELAEKVLHTLETKESNFHVLYPDEMPLKDKIRTVAQKIYGASDVEFSKSASKELDHLTALGMGNAPVCIAKTQYSLSDDPKLLGRPENFTLHVRDVYPSRGAGFVVAVTGNIMTMPGLPKAPAAWSIDVTDDGKITGLF